MKTRFMIPNPGDRPVPFSYDSDIRFQNGDLFYHRNSEKDQQYEVVEVRFIVDDLDGEIVQLVSLVDAES